MNAQQPEAVYQYKDERGKLLYEVLRFPGKRFAFRRPNGSGQWTWNLGDARRVPFRLDELVLADEIFLVEGEKDCETLRKLDLVATTNPTGANGWRLEFADYFRGKKVIVIPDRDAPGHAWAERVLGDLHGVAASIKLVDLPGLEPGSGDDVSDWISHGHTKKELLDLIEAASTWRPRSSLPGKIDSVRRSLKLQGFEKRRCIARAVLSDFSERGQFYRARHNKFYFFENRECRLYRADSEDFLRLLAEASRLNPTEIEFKFALEEIKTHVNRSGSPAQVYQFGHLDRQTRKLYISDLGGGVFVITEKGITGAENGTDDVLFESFPTAEVVQYVPASQRSASLDEFLREINFDPKGGLTNEALCWLLRIVLYSFFVPEVHRTRVIPLFVGPQGSGKTTCARCLGKLLLGSRFNVAQLESSERGEQAFIAALCGAPFIAFDNADARNGWLADHLARYATGAEFNFRELYTTNGLATFEPVASLVLTARDPQFRRPDVADRLLIFPLKRLTSFVCESALADRMEEARNGLFSELIDDLQRVLPFLLDAKESLTTFRMADFAAFGAQIMRPHHREAEFQTWLRAIAAAQASYATEDEPLVELLATWLEKDGKLEKEAETGGLFVCLKEIAEERHLPTVKSASALGKRLRELEPILRSSLGVEISRIRVGHSTRWKFTQHATENFADFDSPESSQSPRFPHAASSSGRSDE